MRQGHASKIDAWLPKMAAETQPHFCDHTKDLGPWFPRAISSRFEDLSGILGFGYLRPNFRQTCANV